jgi:hypothetical protein
LSVTPLYASAADVLVLWDDVNATWRSLPSVSLPMTVAGGGTGQTALTANAVLVGNGTGPITASAITSDNGTTLRVSTNAVIGNAVTSPPSHALTINAAATSPQPANALIFGASEGATPYVIIDSYSATPGNGGGLTTRRTRGTAAGPTAVQSGDNLLALCAQGWGASGFGIGALIAANATENWTNTAQGAAIAFNTTANTTGANVERMRIDHNGNVGIGTTTPAFKLHVHHATDVNFMLFNNGGRSALAALNDANNVWNPIDINPSGNVYLSSATGNVGIGTTGPGAKLHVSGPDSSNLLYVSGGSKAIRIGASSTTASIDCVDMPVTSLQPLSVGGSIVLLTTNGAERMRIDNTGNVGIGTTGPTARLHVINPTSAWTSTLIGNATTGQSYGLSIQAGTNASDYSLLVQNMASANSVIVYGNGVCYNTSGSWASLSDVSVKQDVKPYRRGLDAIVALNPVEFRYAKGTPFAEPDKPSRLLFGLIADEVKPHVPEIVGTTTATVGKKEGVELSTLEPGNLIYALINAVKELKSELDALKGGGVAPARLAR